MSELATRAAIEAVWRIESARLLGGLVREADRRRSKVSESKVSGTFEAGCRPSG